MSTKKEIVEKTKLTIEIYESLIADLKARIDAVNPVTNPNQNWSLYCVLREELNQKELFVEVLKQILK